MIPPRIPLSRDDIAEVVQTFYARVQQQPELAPIFAAHVTDWPSHEEKITRFWANAILFERAYDGNPMQVHMQAGNVQPEHFQTWLALFDQTLTDCLPPDTAAQWSALAHRIGRGLSLGLREFQRPKDAVPDLTSGL